MTYIHVVVPSYNCYDWIGWCLASLAIQDHAHFDVTVIDDASTDVRQAPFIKEFCNTRNWEFTQNPTNLRCPANIWLGIDRARLWADDVVFLLDGDDWLPHERVLSTIAAEYDNDPKLLLTYGSYAYWPPEDHYENPAIPYPDDVIENLTFRSHNILYNHPITFKKKLWDQVGKEDLQFEDGTWFQGSYDDAIMLPMMELAKGRFRCLSETLYMYNARNPISDSKANQSDCLAASGVVRSRPPRQPLGLEW